MFEEKERWVTYTYNCEDLSLAVLDTQINVGLCGYRIERRRLKLRELKKSGGEDMLCEGCGRDGTIIFGETHTVDTG
jgi:hypothetical protein